MQGQSVAAEAFRVGGLADFQYAQDVSFEMSPTELTDAFVVLQISGATVAAKDAGVYFAQQLHQHLGSARSGDPVKDEVRRNQSPKPALFAAGPVSGFVAVDDRLVGQLPLQFRTGIGHRFADLFPTVLNAPQTERDGQTEGDSPPPASAPWN
jgi:hypothetical protein